MPSSGELMKLSDLLIDVQSGYWGTEDSSADRPHLVRVIRNADISREGKRKSFATRAFNNREYEKAALAVGDIALATSGEVGKAWLVDEDGFHVTNFLKRLRVDRALVLPHFLRYMMDTESLRAELAAHTGGSAIQNLRKSFFTSTSVKIPPMDEQQRIVDLVGSIDTYIDSQNDQIGATRNLRSGILADLFDGRVTLDEAYDKALSS